VAAPRSKSLTASDSYARSITSPVTCLGSAMRLWGREPSIFFALWAGGRCGRSKICSRSRW
jgi:hypothetical protein